MEKTELLLNGGSSTVEVGQLPGGQLGFKARSRFRWQRDETTTSNFGSDFCYYSTHIGKQYIQAKVLQLAYKTRSIAGRRDLTTNLPTRLIRRGIPGRKG